jgi:hypothetical protein
MKIRHTYDMLVDKAYIIRVPGHEESKRLAARCLASCSAVGQKAEFWPAVDGTKQLPDEHIDSVLNIVKLTNHFLSRTEVACVLSHLSLWSHCAQTDKPIVVLEHDAVMLRPYENHVVYNSICYLGCKEQKNQGWPVLPTPPHGTEGPGYHFILRAHAYAIDPAVARHMVAHVIRYGINESADKLLRADIFPIHQFGLFAYDEPGKSSIDHLHSDDMLAKRNDNLEK